MNGLDCNEFVELVTAYLDGALDADTERHVIEHLAICDGCAGYLDQIRATIRALGALPSEPLNDGTLNDDTKARLLAAFRNRPHGVV